MKKIFTILCLLIAGQAFSQSDDTSFYTKYPGIYGLQYPRIMTTKVLRPPTDTIYTKTGLAIKAGTLYVGNGTYWSTVTVGTPSINIYNTSDHLTGDRTVTGLNNAYSLNLDSLKSFRVQRDGVTRISVGSTSSFLISQNTNAAVTANPSNAYMNYQANAFRVFADSMTATKKIAYETNINGSLTPNALTSKSYVDSLLAAIAPSLTATYVGFGSGSNLLTGTNKLTYDAGVLSVGNTLANNGRLDVGYARLLEFASVSTPPASSGHVYAKNDGTIHYINSAGTDYDLTTGGSGETNTASNLGGGLANYSTKVGVDLRFNSFSSSHFDLTSNLISIKSSVALPGNPTTTTQSQNDNSTKIATTAYTDLAVSNAVAAVNPATAVQAATTSASNTSGLTYSNGVSGIGATFTGSINTAITFDGYTFTAVGQRVLIKNDTQSPSGAFNGMYYVTQVQTVGLPPILTRALDYDMPSDINNTGAIAVQFGTVNGGSSWLLTSQVTTVGTDPLTYIEFTYPTSSLVLTTRTISTNAPLKGGGDLSINRTLDIDTSVAVANSVITNKREQKILDSLSALGALPTSIYSQIRYKYVWDISGSTNANMWINSGNGGSVLRNNTLINGWFGCVDFSTGVNTNGVAYAHWGDNSHVQYFAMDAAIRYNAGAKIRLEDLSDGTNTYRIWSGIANHHSSFGSITDGCFFTYTNADSSGQFVCITMSNSTATKVASGITVAADTDYLLEVTVFNTHSVFFINKVQVADITTNIPYGVSRYTSFNNSISKSAGTSPRLMYTGFIALGDMTN